MRCYYCGEPVFKKATQTCGFCADLPELDEGHVSLRDVDAEEKEIAAAESVNVLAWKQKVIIPKRRSPRRRQSERDTAAQMDESWRWSA